LQAQEATPTPRPELVRQPTQTPRPIGDPPTDTLQANLLPPAPTIHAPPLFTDTPAPLPTDPFAAPTATALPPYVVIGYSVQGRALEAWRFGAGERILLLVGGIHGGWEANTTRLMRQLIEYFTANPQSIPPTVTVIIVPTANPDGSALGRVWSGRFNGNSVDLNRNWACGWSSVAYWQQARVNPGASPASEPEVQALMRYIQDMRPAAALFYHSAADGVFAGSCGGDHGSAALSEVLGRAAGYRFGSPFSAYPVTGTAADWVNEQGIPSADVELITSTDSEYERNLRGVLAVMGWLEETD
jgi:predicted deacylase